MINIIDDYLSTGVFEKLQEYCKQDFQIVDVGGIKYSVLETPKYLLPTIAIPNHSITMSFIRNAYKGFDKDLRIHADGLTTGQKTDVASVLYINDDKDVTHNGTNFYKHHKHGYKLPSDCTNEEFDRLLSEDSTDLEKWVTLDTVSARPNRILTYDANYFHGKFPREITKGTRIVLVTFYQKL